MTNASSQKVFMTTVDLTVHFKFLVLFLSERRKRHYNTCCLSSAIYFACSQIYGILLMNLQSRELLCSIKSNDSVKSTDNTNLLITLELCSIVYSNTSVREIDKMRDLIKSQ